MITKFIVVATIAIVAVVIAIVELVYILFNFAKTRELKKYVDRIKKHVETKS